MIPELELFHDILTRVRAEVGKVVIGQHEAIRDSLIVILSGQHALIEGVPGLGKTLLVRTLARVMGCPFGRIQFTPDLMPADIIGTSIFNLQTNEFKFSPGPVFTAFLLADEINRAPAKTQSALLQAMQERTIAVDRKLYRLPSGFTVFATQNPVEFEGTYPLPEAQKDRFMMRIGVGWPEASEELTLAHRMLGSETPEAVLNRGDAQPVLGEAELTKLRDTLRHVVFRDELLQYLVEIVRRTRQHDSILIGAGPRATQSIVLGSRAYAAVDGRDFVTPDDIRAVAVPILDHRLVLRPEAEMEDIKPAELIQSILRDVAIPR